MNLRATLLVFACSAVSMAGCVVTDNTPSGGLPVYSSCGTLSDCSVDSTRCQDFSVNWGSGVATDAICTIACASDANCPVGPNGQQGFCAVGSFLGNDMQTCLPRCYSNSDCDTGFSCLDAQQLSTGTSVPYGTRVCVPGQPPASSTMYETCGTLSNCSSDATRCQYFAADWGAGAVATNLCTVACASDAYCPIGANGQFGFCAPFGFLGNNMQTCVPRCYTNADCETGSSCLDSSQLSTSNLAPYGTRVCVPGTGANVPKQAAYDICSTLSDCASGLTRCEQLDAKLPNSTTTAAQNICTVACSSDANCPGSHNGQAGYCAAGGVVSSMQVCVERCSLDADCGYGFRCADMKDIPNLPYGVNICVPY